MPAQWIKSQDLDWGLVVPHAASVSDRAVKGACRVAKNGMKSAKKQLEHSEQDSREVQGALGMDITAQTFANADSHPTPRTSWDWNTLQHRKATVKAQQGTANRPGHVSVRKTKVRSALNQPL